MPITLFLPFPINHTTLLSLYSPLSPPLSIQALQNLQIPYLPSSQPSKFLQQTDTDQSLLNNHMKEEPEETDPESPTNRIHLQKETQGAKEFDIFEEANRIKVAEEKENEKERKSGIKRSLCRNINREYLHSFNSKKFPIPGITDTNGVDGAPYFSYNPRGKPKTKLDKGVYKHLLKNLDDKKIPTFIVNRKREFLFESKNPF